ncbi:stress response translation initiation inhibitor YciH [Candidatus Micrarchaeota archaeon]|nr:MAG: stress response translation initiation inhibitor YciH [Candidatus Micrarchaeota archaeon]
MGEICPVCGLPKELCVCKEITKESAKIKISTERKKFKKYMTIIEGFDDGADITAIGREFKKKLACGGTIKNKRIELQGDHREKVKQMLLEMGYDEKQIEVY